VIDCAAWGILILMEYCIVFLFFFTLEIQDNYKPALFSYLHMLMLEELMLMANRSTKRNGSSRIRKKNVYMRDIFGAV